MLNCFFFFNATATTEIYTYLHTLSLNDALPILFQIGKARSDELEAAVDGIVAGQRRHEKIPYAVRFRALLQFLDYRQSLPPLSTSLLRGIGLIMGPNHIVHEITDPITPHGFRGRHREIHIAVLIWPMGMMTTW